MKHEACQALLVDLAYGELGARKASQAQVHLATCAECKLELERIAATRKTMQVLGPSDPPLDGERILLAAARQAVERSPVRRPFFSTWFWKASLTTALVLVVAGVSVEVLHVRDEGLLAPAPVQVSSEAPSAPVPAAKSESQAQPAAKPSLSMNKASPVFSGAGSSGPAPKPARAMRKAATARDEARSSGEMSFGQLKDKDDRRERGVAAPAAPEREPPAGAAPAKAVAPAASPAAMAAIPGSADRLTASKKMKAAEQSQDELAQDAEQAEGYAMGELRSDGQARARVNVLKGSISGNDPEQNRRLASIDEIVDGIDRRQAIGKLVESVREPCAGSGDVERRAYRDQRGRIVKYVRRSEMEGIEETVSHYYDSAGQLRFALVARTDATGSTDRTRLYFSAGGMQLPEGSTSEEDSQLSRPLVRDQEAALRSPARCRTPAEPP